jgi:hypothetical protein
MTPEKFRRRDIDGLECDIINVRFHCASVTITNVN